MYPGIKQESETAAPNSQESAIRSRKRFKRRRIEAHREGISIIQEYQFEFEVRVISGRAACRRNEILSRRNILVIRFESFRLATLEFHAPFL